MEYSFYLTNVRFLTFFPSFRLVTMAMTNTFSCQTICQKFPTVLGFGPVIIMFCHCILIYMHFWKKELYWFNTHMLVTTDLEMQCKQHRRLCSETMGPLKCTDCYITITIKNHSIRVSFKPLWNWHWYNLHPLMTGEQLENGHLINKC